MEKIQIYGCFGSQNVILKEKVTIKLLKVPKNLLMENRVNRKIWSICQIIYKLTDKNTENLPNDLLMKLKVPRKILKLNEDFTEEQENSSKNDVLNCKTNEKNTEGTAEKRLKTKVPKEILKERQYSHEKLTIR